ncbi:MAG: peptidoglycan DD-metalloendopeptidase family protein [Candidatus Abawacabacteria bacterium]|nr:peptidoglycan DD-metalloendopeptidase family protein [Candidatus Abawacabacteria bacterium]
MLDREDPIQPGNAEGNDVAEVTTVTKATVTRETTEKVIYRNSDNDGSGSSSSSTTNNNNTGSSGNGESSNSSGSDTQGGGQSNTSAKDQTDSRGMPSSGSGESNSTGGESGAAETSGADDNNSTGQSNTTAKPSGDNEENKKGSEKAADDEDKKAGDEADADKTASGEKAPEGAEQDTAKTEQPVDGQPPATDAQTAVSPESSPNVPANAQPVPPQPIQATPAQPAGIKPGESVKRPDLAPGTSTSNRPANVRTGRIANESNKAASGRPDSGIANRAGQSEKRDAKSQSGDSDEGTNNAKAGAEHSKSSSAASSAIKEKSTGNAAKGVGKADVRRAAIQKTVGTAIDKAGKVLGLNKVQNEFLKHLAFLLIWLFLGVTGIGIILFVIHVFYLIYWIFSKGRYKELKGLVALFFVISLGGMFVQLLVVTTGATIIACQIGQSRIPFGVPIGYTGRIGSVFNADWGAFAEVCSKINLLGAGVGSGASSSANAGGRGGATRSIALQDPVGAVLIQSTMPSSEPPVIQGTLLTRPQALPAGFATQTNRAGYVSPAHCRLGDLPYSDRSALKRVRLPNGQDTIITLPIHQTVECIENYSSRTTVRSVHTGKIIRLVYGDSLLGDNITIEYPNGLKVSYYHVALLPTLTLGKTVNAGEQIGTLAQTGQNTFKGVKMRFELKSTDGSWQPFDPINQSNMDASILTTFPCSDDATKKCLLL